ncbi:unnamed protein product [Schistosoma margrebowiei]|uniref:DUF6451 domain-containing protein n=1 Tax=Schistosoma margrebowiei TaxID=48269 RepID=A0A3P8F6A2_9TREM|nr:unnamed protein product [Schistosoma margrebowiei]
MDSSIIDEQTGSDVDEKARIGKASVAIPQLSSIWNSKQLSTNISVTILNTNVKIVLMYRAIDEHGGSDADVKARIGKPRAANLQLKNIWYSKQLSNNTKVRIFNINVKTVLLYGVETWRTIKVIIKKIQGFINSSL